MVGEDALGLRFVSRDRETRKQASVLLFRPEIVALHGDAIARTGELAMRIDHPNVVRTLHQSIEGLEAVRVSEWDPGGTLGAVLDEVPLMSSSVRWGLDIARGLEAAHSVGLLHRGVAPYNVRLVRRSDPPDRARLHDWGLAGLLLDGGDPLSSTGLHFTGGSAWLAPEYIQGNRFDERSDLYALGAVLFHCLTGHPPYIGPELKVLAGHVNEPVPAPSQHMSGVPHWLDELVIGLLAKAPEHRPQTAAEVAAILQHGAAQLHDAAAHPQRVTASVAPTRLPDVALRGTASHQAPPRRVSRTPAPAPTRQQRSLAVWLGVAAALTFLLALALLLT